MQAVGQTGLLTQLRALMLPSMRCSADISTMPDAHFTGLVAAAAAVGWTRKCEQLGAAVMAAGEAGLGSAGLSSHTRLQGVLSHY